ncbi:ABC transporter permease [Saccharothrix sp. NRRL B-16314]|uniref:ABC transporter permease n=1 Tax=Saccharothrix sp. NRRL B-16314 TaxID=1463825 RepID=UPI00052571F6|nr:ABC transporter permease [Saccharothrix sp. NRRL B-16314]
MTEIGSPVAQAPSPSPAEASQFDTTSTRKQSQVILRRFMRHKAAVFGVVLLVLLVLFAFLGGAIWKYSYTDLGFKRYLPPSADHPFGTDRLGADMVAQLIRGTQFSLQIAVVVAVLSTIIGVVLGALAGYLKGWVDTVISRFIDLLLVIPSLVIAAVLVRNSFVVSVAGNGGKSNWMIVALYMGLIGWLSIARVIRGMVLSLREKEFVEAARALGASTFRIVFRHILPNTVDVIIVNATLAIAQAVLLEAALSFLGLGVQSPDTSLGLMISLNKNELTLHPWLFFTTFVFIVLISLSVNFIGDGLRDAFDPRQKRVKA